MRFKSPAAAVVFCLIISVSGCGTVKRATEPVYNGVKSVAEFADILEKYPNGVFSNRNGEQMRTQILSFQFVIGNRIYFCTGSEKPLYEQLVKFPYVSYCTFPQDFEPVLSLNGKVVFTDDVALKERVFGGTGYASRFIIRHYQTPYNPNLKLFYIDVEEIELYSNRGPEIYRTI